MPDFHHSSHFCTLQLFQTNYLEVGLCPVSLLIYILGQVDHSQLQMNDSQYFQFQFKQAAGRCWIFLGTSYTLIAAKQHIKYLWRWTNNSKYLYISNCIFTAKGWTVKKLFWDVFSGLIVLSSWKILGFTVQSFRFFFVKQCHILKHICGTNICREKYLPFYTSQKRNHQSWAKNKQKQGQYF